MGSNLVDENYEIDCGSFFDHIDDLIEFPLENECGGDLPSTDRKDFPSIWNDPLPDTDSIFSGSHYNSASDMSTELDLSTELSVSYEDIVQLEWLSTFVEDSFSGGGLTLGKENIPLNKEPLQAKFQTSSPVSVLESSSSSSTSSCSGEKIVPLSCPCHRGPQRARTKRPRPATFNPPPVIQQPFVAQGLASESENFAESPIKKNLHPVAASEQKKKKKIKMSFPLALIETNQNPTSQTVRKCQHCEITKTPQWRAGPMGPKTLCNACGVRYKSGRLFPEYRPAASPTFVPSLHSNSHKKVIEMRTKVVPDITTTTVSRTASPATAIQAEFNPSKKESLDEEYK